MYHFVTEMYTLVHISVTKWSIVGYVTGALCDLHCGICDWCIVWFMQAGLIITYPCYNLRPIMYDILIDTKYDIPIDT